MCKFFRWVISKFSRKPRCCHCYRVLTAEEIYYYGRSCEKCERKWLAKDK
jgi:hypothetical protein